MRTLLVEDDALLGEGVADGLTQAGFSVKHVTSGESAKVAMLAEPIGLVVLDLGLALSVTMAVLAAGDGIRVPGAACSPSPRSPS